MMTQAGHQAFAEPPCARAMSDAWQPLCSTLLSPGTCEAHRQATATYDAIPFRASVGLVKPAAGVAGLDAALAMQLPLGTCVI